MDTFAFGQAETTASEVTSRVCTGIQQLHIEDRAIALLNLKRQDGLQALDAQWNIWDFWHLSLPPSCF